MTTIKKNKPLLALAFAESVSSIGDWIAMMAVLAMLVFRGGGGVAQSGAIFLAGLLPTLLCSPLAGWLCDRFDRRRLMIASELASGLLISGLIFTRSPVLVYLLLALQAASASLMAPARQASIPSLVERQDLLKANAFLQQLAALVKIGSPVLAGFILVLMTPQAAVVLDVVSFAISALLLSRLPALPAGAAAPVLAGGASSVAAPGTGLTALLRGIPGLRLLLGSVLLTTLIIVGFDVLSPVYSRDSLAGGQSLFGLMVGLVGVGTLAANLYLAAGRAPRDPWKDIRRGLFLLALIPAVLALASALPSRVAAQAVSLAACLVGGFGSGLIHTNLSTLLQLLSPPEVLGRTGGLLQAAAVAGQLAGAVLTPLAVPALLSSRAYFVLCGLALALLAAWLGIPLRSPRMAESAVK